MYKIHADSTLIYDSTVEDFKIASGSGTLETNKAGSFTFSLYPDHFFYNQFVKKKTVIKVTKSDRVLFRGRVLDDKENFWRRKEQICEGERNLLQDSIIRPYSITGTPEELFTKIITEHNDQVDEFKRFKIGQVTVIDPDGSREYTVTGYDSALANLVGCLVDVLGGYLHISHGDDGTEDIPTLNYLADFTTISSQNIEFGSNLRDFVKTGTGQTVATAIIPLGAEQEDGSRVTIAGVNDGLDYVYDEAAVAVHGWIFDTAYFDDVADPGTLKTLGLDVLNDAVKEEISVDLTSVDLHLLDRSIESYGVDTYVRCISSPHNFAETLLCHKQTFNLLNPQNDAVVLGGSCRSLTGTITKLSTAKATGGSSAEVNSLRTTVSGIQANLAKLNYATEEYKIAQQQLTGLMAKSFGVFKTSEAQPDGSTVHYLHNKPTLEDSDTIWKQAGDAFTVSTDGGNTWNAGMDSSGNAFLNMLAVIGIEATWINCDNLTAISANLGGWLIDNEKIYKVIQHPGDSTIRYRVYFKPPVPSSGTVTTEILTCEISRDSGATWVDLLVMDADGAAVFHSEDKGTYKIRGSYVELIDADGVQIARIGTQSRTSNEITSRAATISTYALEEDEIIEEEPILPETPVEEEIIEEVIYENIHRPEVVLKENTENEFQAILNTTGLFFGNSEAANMAYIELDSGKYRFAVDEIYVRGDITVEGNINSYGGGIWTDEGGGYDGYVNGMYFRGGVLVSVE